MNNPLYKTFSTDELDANYGTVSLNKCGICLCRQGWADVLMNNHRYHIEKNGLCLYTPYTFIRILQHSDEFDGYLMETDLEVLSAALEMLQATAFRSGKLLRLVVQNLIQAFLFELMEIYFDSSPVEESRQGREEQIFNTFLMSVHRHCDKERSVMFYADEQNLSPNYLSSVVRAKSGRTAIQWIETITLIHAQHYLVSTRLSVKEVAEKLNFPDQSTFGRYFKKLCGASPKEYRKKLYES